MNREVIFLKKADNACTHYRVTIPAKHLQSLDVRVSLINSVNQIDLSKVQDKIYIFGRSCLYSELDKFREIKKNGGIAVYEIDDDLLDLPFWNPASPFFLKAQVVIRNFLREADHVIVTTEPLKQNCRKFNSNVSIIDNYIDFDYLNELVLPNIINRESGVVSRHALRDRFLLLWGGSITHKVDLKVAQKQLIHFFKKYPEAGLIAIHTLNKEIFHSLDINQLYLIPAVQPSQYLSLLNTLPANIGIAPLANYPFNLCKSRLKIIEYMSAGIVPLASNLEPFSRTLKDSMYKNLLCSDKGWFPKLEDAYNCWEFSIIKDNVKSFARENFDIKKSNWLQVLSSL